MAVGGGRKIRDEEGEEWKERKKARGGKKGLVGERNGDQEHKRKR